MPIVTETEIDGYQTCSRNRLEFGHCAGYDSRPVRIRVEDVVTLFGDQHGDWNDPYARLPSNSHEYLRTLDGELTGTCEFCGSPAALSREPRPHYARLSDRGPEELVRQREAERTSERREREALAFRERSATADEQRLTVERERLALQERDLAAREESNRLRALELERQQEPLPPAPKRRPAKDGP